MSDQRNLFSGLIDPAVPYAAGSDTSKEAADRIREFVTRDRARILGYLKAFGPATDQELQTALDMPESTERPRRGELVTAGYVYDTGATRPTRAGRSATVWAATKERKG